jgi:hypothetical protein
VPKDAGWVSCVRSSHRGRDLPRLRGLSESGGVEAARRAEIEFERVLAAEVAPDECPQGDEPEKLDLEGAPVPNWRRPRRADTRQVIAYQAHEA